MIHELVVKLCLKTEHEERKREGWLKQSKRVSQPLFPTPPSEPPTPYIPPAPLRSHPLPYPLPAAFNLQHPSPPPLIPYPPPITPPFLRHRAVNRSNASRQTNKYTHTHTHTRSPKPEQYNSEPATTGRKLYIMIMVMI